MKSAPIARPGCCPVRLRKHDGPIPDDKIDAVLLLKAETVMQAMFVAAALDDAGIPYVARGLGITDSLGGSAGGNVPFGAQSSPRSARKYMLIPAISTAPRKCWTRQRK